MAKRLVIFVIVAAATMLLSIFPLPVSAQEPDDPEVWLEEQSWEGEGPVLILAMKMASAEGLPQADAGQCARFGAHILEDAEHISRIPLIREVLTGLASGTLLANQLGYSGSRGVAFVQTSQGKAVLIWGASTVPTAFSGFSADYVRRELSRLNRVDPSSAKARRILAAIAACLLQGVPQEAPAPIPVPTRESVRQPFPGFTTEVATLPIGALVLIGLVFLLLLTGAKTLAR